MRLGERAGSAPQNEVFAKSIMCSSFIQNMSCRPRTQVRSERLTLSKVPDRLKGEKIIVYPGWNIPACLKSYAGANPDMCVAIFNALLALGRRRSLKSYKHFIESQPAHEQSLMKWVLRVPEEIAKLPGVGFIKRPGTCDGLNRALTIQSLHATLFITARSNRSVYIRNKSPLLSLISADRRLQIIFVSKRR
jgi:hypothetical protein